MPSNPKVAGLTDAEFRGWIELLCIASQHRTNGVVTPALFRKVVPAAKTRRGLVDKRFVHEILEGFLLHDYLKHQRSKEEIDELAKKRRAAGKAGGIARSNRQASA